jgi:hypothetical protein
MQFAARPPGYDISEFSSHGLLDFYSLLCPTGWLAKMQGLKALSHSKVFTSLFSSVIGELSTPVCFPHILMHLSDSLWPGYLCPGCKNWVRRSGWVGTCLVQWPWGHWAQQQLLLCNEGQLPSWQQSWCWQHTSEWLGPHPAYKTNMNTRNTGKCNIINLWSTTHCPHNW